MMVLQRGARGKVSQFGSESAPMVLKMRVDGPGMYDCTCFGLDAAGKLSDEAYMTFYNQPATPCGGVKWSEGGGGADFALDLSALPASIDKLSFTVSLDGAGTMGDLRSIKAVLSQNGADVAGCELSGKDFSAETAVIALELYRKPDWRVSAVMRGFNGGLGDLLRNYGGEEASGDPEPAPASANQSAARPAPAPASAPAPAPGSGTGHKIDLEKKLAKAPGLVDLAKPLKVELAKRNLQDVTARVALVMDISGSMTGRYKNGTVQSVVNKTLPLAVQFDDDGNLDFWYYGNQCRKMDDVTLDNYQRAVPEKWRDLMYALGGGNNEPVAMREVIDFYKGTSLPVYILFVTDGGVGSEHKIAHLMREASSMPLFWQFVGVGGHNYGVLERLDRMDGREVDNAGFFALDDFMTVPDQDLYARLLGEFPAWLSAARGKGIVK